MKQAGEPGMGRITLHSFRKRHFWRALFSLALFVPFASPGTLSAQLVRENAAPSSAPSAATQSAQSVAPTGKRLLSRDFTLQGDSHWTATDLGIHAGERLVFTASGTLHYLDAKSDNGPTGLSRSFKDLLRVLPDNDSGRGALIGRIGDADTAQPFLIGAQKDIVAPADGKLALGINQEDNDSANGSYTVHLDVYAADASSASAVLRIAKRVSSIPGVNQGLMAKIPRRVSDKSGDPGDMVNLLILGSEGEMQKAFTSAGWVKVDADVEDALLHGLLESLSKESYLTMPMSQLYLFGRPQDYGWAHAEPISVVRTRNHLRIWKAPFTVKGETLWVGAATHDIGFERDQRNNKITHKIDPDVDLERDFVEKTLCNTGMVAEVSRILPKNPVKDARTATGGSFHSSGDLLILKLASSAGNPQNSDSASKE
jgi:LssY C-terminus